MRAKYEIGDVLTVNDEYRRQGSRYFGKHLEHRNFVGKVIAVHENIDDERDGQGDIWQNFYDFAGGVSICELFLKRRKVHESTTLSRRNRI